MSTSSDAYEEDEEGEEEEGSIYSEDGDPINIILTNWSIQSFDAEDNYEVQATRTVERLLAELEETVYDDSKRESSLPESHSAKGCRVAVGEFLNNFTIFRVRGHSIGGGNTVSRKSTPVYDIVPPVRTNAKTSVRAAPHEGSYGHSHMHKDATLTISGDTARCHGDATVAEEEEVFAIDGVLEETLAMDQSEDPSPVSDLSPVQAVRNCVMAELFDAIWVKLVRLLVPVLRVIVPSPQHKSNIRQKDKSMIMHRLAETESRLAQRRRSKSRKRKTGMDLGQAISIRPQTLHEREPSFKNRTLSYNLSQKSLLEAPTPLTSRFPAIHNQPARYTPSLPSIPRNGPLAVKGAGPIPQTAPNPESRRGIVVGLNQTKAALGKRGAGARNSYMKPVYPNNTNQWKTFWSQGQWQVLGNHVAS